jgi:hypothetical protein
MSRLILLIVVALGAAAIAGLPSALAQERAGAATRLRVDEPTRTSTRGQLVLSATLMTGDGRFVSDRAIDFYQQTEFFGRRDALIGTATTDTTGVAILVYQPALRGTQTLVARFGGSGGFAAAEATTTIEVREVAEPFEPEPLPLATVRQWLPFGLGATVISVWAILLGVLARTAWGIKAAGRQRG